MPTIEELSLVSPLGDGSYRIDVPDTWQQGRGAFGGLVVAFLTNAMLAEEEDSDRVFRAISADLCGPLQVGEATIDVQVLRRGNNLSSLNAMIIQQDEVVARGSTVLAKDRGIQMPTDASAPDAPPWSDINVAPVGPPLAPVFTQHYEFRAFGNFIFSGADRPLVTGYVRHKERGPQRTHVGLLALLDAHWPSYMVMESTFRPGATVAYNAQIVCNPAELDPEAPLLFRSWTEAAYGGYLVEFRELWHEGEPVAFNQQTFVIIK